MFRRLLGPSGRPPQPLAARDRGREESIHLQGLPDVAGPEDAERPGTLFSSVVRVHAIGMSIHNVGTLCDDSSGRGCGFGFL